MQRLYGEKRDVYGRVEPNASVSVFVSGTQALATIYNASDPLVTPTAPKSNPFYTDANGEYSFAAPDGLYDITVQGAGAIDYKPKISMSVTATVNPPQDASQINYTAPYVNAVPRNQFSHNADTVSIFDFMTQAQIASVRACDNLVDVTVPIQNAIDEVVVTTPNYKTKRLYFPAGSYTISNDLLFPNSTLTGSNRMTLYGDGPDMTNIVQTNINKSCFNFQEVVGSAGCQTVINNMGFQRIGSNLQNTVTSTGLIIANFSIGLRIFNNWFTSSYNAILLAPKLGQANIGEQDIYINWNVFEFCQNAIAGLGLTNQYAITNRSRSGGVATLMTSIAHSMIQGQQIMLTGVGGVGYNAPNITISAVTLNTFSYICSSAPAEVSTPSGGTVYYVDTMTLHITNNEFATSSRTDIGATDYAINMVQCGDIQVIGNKFAFGVGRCMNFTNCQDVVINGNQTISNKWQGAGNGAYGQNVLKINGGRNFIITGNELATDTGEPVIEVTNGAIGVSIHNNLIPYSAGTAAIYMTGAVASQVSIDENDIQNTMFDGILFNSASIINSRISNNHFQAINTGFAPIKSASGSVPNTLQIFGNTPSGICCAIEDVYRQNFKYVNASAATVSLMTIVIPPFGSVSVNMKASGLLNSVNSKATESRWTVYRGFSGAPTLTVVGADITYGVAGGTLAFGLIASGNDAVIQITTNNANGMDIDFYFEIIGRMTSCTLMV